jgi:hypothetical protein
MPRFFKNTNIFAHPVGRFWHRKLWSEPDEIAMTPAHLDRILTMELSQFLAAQHPRLVPFPIVLLLTALVLDAAGLIRRSPRPHWAARLAWLAGTGAALAREDVAP